MQIYDLTILYPYRPLQKNWIPAAIAAVASIAGTLLSNKSNKDINKKQIENQHELLKKEQDYNTYMMQNQKQMQMNDAKSAGINPAYAGSSSLVGGISSSPSAPSVSQIPMENPLGGAIQAVNTYLLKKQVDADSRLKNAESERQELLNEDKKAKNNVLNDSYTITQVDPKTGKVIPNDKVDEWSLQHPNEIPELVSMKDTRLNRGAEGRFEGNKMLREWKSRVNNLDAQDWKNALDKAVHQLQLNDKGVMEALSQMPRKEFDELCQIVTSLANENSVWDKKKDLLQIDLDMAKLQKRITENSNLYEYIEKLFDGDFTWKDFGKMVAMTLVGLVQNLGGIGVGVTNLRSLGQSKPNRIGFR